MKKRYVAGMNIPLLKDLCVKWNSYIYSTEQNAVMDTINAVCECLANMGVLIRVYGLGAKVLSKFTVEFIERGERKQYTVLITKYQPNFKRETPLIVGKHTYMRHFQEEEERHKINKPLDTQ